MLKALFLVAVTTMAGAQSPQTAPALPFVAKPYHAESVVGLEIHNTGKGKQVLPPDLQEKFKEVKHRTAVRIVSDKKTLLVCGASEDGSAINCKLDKSSSLNEVIDMLYKNLMFESEEKDNAYRRAWNDYDRTHRCPSSSIAGTEGHDWKVLRGSASPK